MSDDHLSNEVSLSAELTERGVKAGAKSRTISSIDRLLGGVVDLVNVPLERAARVGRAKSDVKVAAIKVLGEMQLEAIHTDPEFAARAMQQHLKVIGTRHENKTEAVWAALEDLKESPPSNEQNNSGGEQLDDAFLNRWERYAEDATSDQLREKWGRVLASEVRTPGTFSAKVMRVIDEMEPSTAITFERFCKYRLKDIVIKYFVDDFSFDDLHILISSGLVIDPGVGKIRHAVARELPGEYNQWLLGIGPRIAAFPVEGALGIPAQDGRLLRWDDKRPAMPIHVLTDVGFAISSIIAHDEEAVSALAYDEIASALAPRPVREYVFDGSALIIQRERNTTPSQ